MIKILCIIIIIIIKIPIIHRILLQLVVFRYSVKETMSNEFIISLFFIVAHKNISQKHCLSLLFFGSPHNRNSWRESIKGFGIRLWKFNSMLFVPISVNNHNKKRNDSQNYLTFDICHKQAG